MSVSPKAFVGIPGVELRPSADPNDHTFHFTIGRPQVGSIASQDKVTLEKAGKEVAGEVLLWEDKKTGHTLSAGGTFSVDVAYDTGYDYGWAGKDGLSLKSFKFITIVDAKKDFHVTVTGELTKFEGKPIRIGDPLKFNPIKIFVGPLPVWLYPQVEIYLFADGSINASARFGVVCQQRFASGILYNKDTGPSVYEKKSYSNSLSVSAEVEASLKAGVSTVPSLLIYKQVGPQVPLNLYLRLSASKETEIFTGCSDMLVQLLMGIGAGLKWDLNGSSKFGKMLHLDKLEKILSKPEIASVEVLLKKWPIGNHCLVDFTRLEVEGESIFATIDKGYTGNFATPLVVKNTGNTPMKWRAGPFPAGVAITPEYGGTLAAGGDTVVQMSVATAGLPAGDYVKNITFYNDTYLDAHPMRYDVGTVTKTIHIHVREPIVVEPPIITAVTSIVPGMVSLTWTFFSSIHRGY